MTTKLMTQDDVLALSPNEFYSMDEAERRAAREEIEAKARAEQEKKDAADAKVAAAQTAHRARWRGWLTHIGNYAGGLPFLVDDHDNQFRPCSLIVKGVTVPVNEGYGPSPVLEIMMPWHTASWDHYTRRRRAAEKCVSRQKKDGSFNYEALGAMAARYVRAELAHQAAQSNMTTAAVTVQALVNELGYRSMEPSTDAAKPVRFKFSINRDLTVDEARSLHAVLLAADLIKAKE